MKPDELLVTYEQLLQDEDTASSAVVECFRTVKPFQRVAQAEMEALVKQSEEVNFATCFP